MNQQESELQSLIEKMLIYRKGPRKQNAVIAFKKAMMTCSVASNHGQLLIRTLRWINQNKGNPIDNNEHVIWWLAKRGVTPTENAVKTRLHDMLKAWEALQEKQTEALIIAMRDGEAVSSYIDGLRESTGEGPTWTELSLQFDWPVKLKDLIIKNLAEIGWITYERDVVRSLKSKER
jgi:hypothetical protein